MVAIFTRYIFLEFEKIFRTSIFLSTSERLLLNITETRSLLLRSFIFSISDFSKFWSECTEAAISAISGEISAFYNSYGNSGTCTNIFQEVPHLKTSRSFSLQFSMQLKTTYKPIFLKLIRNLLKMFKDQILTEFLFNELRVCKEATSINLVCF